MVCPACTDAKKQAEAQAAPQAVPEVGTGLTSKSETVRIVPASLMLRFLAYSMDKAIFQISTVALCCLFFGAALLLRASQVALTGGAPPNLGVLLGTFGVGILVIILSPLVVYALFEQSRWQGTPGKIFLKLAVTDLEGQPLTFSRALMRNALRLIGALPILIGGGIFLVARSFGDFAGPLLFGGISIGVLLNCAVYLWVFFNPERQGLHDRISSCLVQERGIAPMWRVVAATLLWLSFVLYAAFFGAISAKFNERRTGPTVSSYRSIAPRYTPAETAPAVSAGTSETSPSP